MHQDHLLNEIVNLKDQMKIGEQEMRRLRAKDLDIQAINNILEAKNKDFEEKIGLALVELERLRKILVFRS